MNELRMRSQTPAKSEALLELARLRQATRLDDHYCIGDFHDGIYECDHVSPYTKSGHNINADVMIVAQDWTSADSFSGAQPDRGSVEFTQGYTPSLSTNRNLDGESRKVWGIRHARLLVPSQIKHNCPTLCGTLQVLCYDDCRCVTWRYEWGMLCQ
ncbi:MAG: hypothetical protein OXE84_00710 [Rhodobacteraceae bacterium]|nr:hypothetical protein [Paracoccaceae bacterium]